MTGNSDEQQIREVIATWTKATAKGDVDAVLELMDRDVVFLTCGNSPIRGRKAFAATMREVIKTVKIESKFAVREINVSGDYAFCWNYLTVTTKPKDGGLPKKREGNILSVFHRERSGKWVIFRDANLLDG